MAVLITPGPAAHRAGRRTAFDLGTGTGVLAAVLARRGIDHVMATGISPRALACAHENVRRLNLSGRIDVVGPGLFPEGRADLSVCNPPWIPARPTSAVEQGVYDPGGGMLRDFLDGLTAHLEPGGEGRLILSDLAEHLGLRTRSELLADIEAAGLYVVDRTDIRPRYPRAGAPRILSTPPVPLRSLRSGVSPALDDQRRPSPGASRLVTSAIASR